MLGRRNNANSEVEEYRDLLETPTEFEDGFTSKAIVGVLFVAFVMIPGNMYLSLMVGGNLGAAAEWVTIILFAEITKRSFTSLSRQEVYVLYYVAAGLIAAETGAFEGLLWNQYLRQSPAALQFGIANLIPDWWAPPLDSPALLQRTFFHPDWAVPIAILIAHMVISRVSWFTMAYVLFRVNSDYERLPFPFAPVAAQGATALAETTQGVDSWRWRVFSAGAMIGMVFGTLYVAIPAISGALLTEPIQLIPIPFVDFTQITGNFIPATPLGFTAHLGPIFAGLVMPFWGVVGTFLGIVAHSVANPILYDLGYLEIWQPGMGAIETFFVNSVDFWMSFGIGTTISIAFIGIWQVISGMRRNAVEKAAGGAGRTWAAPAGRGDFPIIVALALYALATAGLIVIAWIFLPSFARFWGFFIFFGFIFTPFQSFVNARLVGMVGQTISIPYVREATIILSGYQGVDIWFMPFPVGNYGAQTQKFREIELTGTSFRSIIRAELVMVPIVLFATFLYSSYIWKLAPIPSASYPYAQVMWRLRALQTCIWFTGTLKSEMTVTPQGAEATWKPSNLVGESWWYWRARAADDQWIETNGKHGDAGPWSQAQAFYTRFGTNAELPPPMPPGALEELASEGDGPRVQAMTPEQLVVLPPAMRPVISEAASAERLAVLTDPASLRVGLMSTPRPGLHVTADRALPDGWHYYFVVDTDPNFTSPWIQRSSDEPWLFRAIKPNIIMAGTAVGLLSYILLSVLGLPILLVFGYVRALTTIPHWMVTEIIGALLARYYFWNKYGRKEWRTYAPVLAVGFACGMALMGMASISIALIQKSVSVLIF
ncbi:MAG: hypothetical protein HN712_17515 [Gemmatimonadetes bacterium]|nr:hypothetical protein [Gemmatimonadota bacterium]MBT6149177.1 hypothetical protein [Gemmatimonadota bacterium]MBT7862119.1 hypothetical protein [Gemmatimonadota bacterium]